MYVGGDTISNLFSPILHNPVKRLLGLINIIRNLVRCHIRCPKHVPERDEVEPSQKEIPDFRIQDAQGFIIHLPFPPCLLYNQGGIAFNKKRLNAEVGGRLDADEEAGVFGRVVRAWADEFTAFEYDLAITRTPKDGTRGGCPRIWNTEAVELEEVARGF